MKHYQVICQSVRGESHIKRGTPREDAAGVLRLEDRIVGVVCDGHGDPRCMRSQVGSQLAVDIALELLRDWVPEDADGAEPLDERVTALAHGIIERWTQATEAHFRENPLTEAELNDAGNLRGSYAQGRHIQHIYGSTLIALVRWEDSLFLLQKGDGHAVVIDRRGGIDDQVIPWDERCYLNFTTSLCDDDAADTFTYRLLRGAEIEDIAAVLLGSDGVEDSFANSDLMGAYYGLLAAECVENGEAATEAAMLNDLAEMSKYGSKDDISVVAVIDPEAIPPLKPTFERMQQRGALALKLDSSAARLSSMEAAFARREQQLEAKRRALEAFRQESARIAAQLEAHGEQANLPDRSQLRRMKRDLEALQLEIDQRNAEEGRQRKRVHRLALEYDKFQRELSAAKVDYARQCEDLDSHSAEPFLNLQRTFDLWVLESSKIYLDDMETAFAELENQLKRAEQTLEDWQTRTRALERRRKELEADIGDADSARRSEVERRRKALEAELEQRAEEEARLEREAAEIQSDYEAYNAKYEAAKAEREQLLKEIEQLK